MSDAKNAEVTFELLGNDPLSWLEEARGLKLSADIIQNELINVLPLSQNLPGIREKKLALVPSYMLLTGFAFENAIKGILVAKNPGLTKDGRLSDSAWKARGGHGISTFARDLSSLDPREIDLLQRLEEYIEWAGRYSIPTKANKFVRAVTPQNRRTYYSNDPDLINKLFEKFCVILEEEWRKRGS
jgi:hypothetical protein